MSNLSNSNIIHIKKDGIEYLQFKKLLEYKDILNHAYGIGLNRNYRTTNQKENAMNDYKDLCSAIGIDYRNCVKPCQEHTSNIKSVYFKINENYPDFEMPEYEKTDGLITNKNKIILATTNADCILLIFFDPIKKVIANVHSGWRGTLQKISLKAVNKMKNEYGCDFQNIICCICPSIRKCHFKVHEDVRKLYYNEFQNLENIDNLILHLPEEERWSIDTVEINKIILKQAGIKEKNIIDCEVCSVCNSNLIHSFRVEKEGYGLSTAIVELK